MRTPLSWLASAILWVSIPQALAQRTDQPSGLDEASVSSRLANLREQIASYRGTLQRLATEEGSLAARELLTKVDGMTAEATRLVANGRHADANDTLRDAYRRVVEGLSRIQSGKTVVLSLKFDSPEAELAYEQRRYQSSQMLVTLTIGQGGVEGERQRTVDGLVIDARRLQAEAGALAASGDVRGAISLMEQAVASLGRALQMMGVPAF